MKDQPAMKRHIPWIVGMTAAALLIFVIRYVITNVDGVKRVPAQPPTLEFVPPPPPPPPPPEPMEQPPEPVEQETVTEPTPEPQQAEQQDTPQAVTMDATGEAGGDSFGIQSGSGKGMGAPSSTGNCVGPDCGVKTGGIGDGFYKKYLRDFLQDTVRTDDKLNKKNFRTEMRIWITGGRITKVEVINSSDPKLDSVLTDALLAARDVDPPPASIKFPQRIVVTGRQSG